MRPLHGLFLVLKTKSPPLGGGLCFPQSPERERDPHAPSLGRTRGTGPAAILTQDIIHTQLGRNSRPELIPQAVHPQVSCSTMWNHKPKWQLLLQASKAAFVWEKQSPPPRGKSQMRRRWGNIFLTCKPKEPTERHLIRRQYEY